MNDVIVIVGPTASGKTSLSIELAIQIGAEIISADSRQVYRGLTIGTGKVTPDEMRGIPHHLLDIADPRDVCTAHEYVRLARPILEDIIARGKCVIICGGTGFYIDALLSRVQIPQVPRNDRLREELAHTTTAELFAMLEEQDPHRAQTIDPHNPVRLVRALEIVEALGAVPQPHTAEFPHAVSWIGIALPPDELHARIEQRLDERLGAGMMDEARTLHSEGLSYQRMTELGLEYRHLARYLEGHVSLDEMRNDLLHDIIQYSKRQMTYWRRNTEIQWVAEPTVQNALKVLEK